MKKSEERNFEALDYGKKKKAKLTNKQYLVYSYLMSISKWDSKNKEAHYYVYKNSFLIKDACALLNISQPTWRSAIKKLQEEIYIFDMGTYYEIKLPNTYAPLNIYLIKFLVNIGAQLKNGGDIVSVYSVLYKYLRYCEINNDQCEITISQLAMIFNSKRNSEILSKYRVMLGIFQTYNLIDLKTTKRNYNGIDYTAYIIKDVNLSLPEDIDRNEAEVPVDISEIIKAIETDIETEVIMENS